MPAEPGLLEEDTDCFRRGLLQHDGQCCGPVSISPGTIATYKADWVDFAAWARARSA